MEFALMLYPSRENFPATITPEEAEIIGKHFQYFCDLMNEGKLNYAGRCEDGRFGIALLNGEYEEEVRNIAKQDPAIQQGIFNFEIIPFRTA